MDEDPPLPRWRVAEKPACALEARPDWAAVQDATAVRSITTTRSHRGCNRLPSWVVERPLGEDPVQLQDHFRERSSSISVRMTGAPVVVEDHALAAVSGFPALRRSSLPPAGRWWRPPAAGPNRLLGSELPGTGRALGVGGDHLVHHHSPAQRWPPVGLRSTPSGRPRRMAFALGLSERQRSQARPPLELDLCPHSSGSFPWGA